MVDETFTAYDIRGKIQEGVSLDVAWNIGKAFADWLPTYGTVAVLRGEGADETLLSAVIEGLRLQGRNVVDYGQGNKEKVVEIIKDQGYSGAVFTTFDSEQQVTVTELYDDKGTLIVAENGLNDIAEAVQGGNFVPAAEKGELTAIA